MADQALLFDVLFAHYPANAEKGVRKRTSVRSGNRKTDKKKDLDKDKFYNHYFPKYLFTLTWRYMYEIQVVMPQPIFRGMSENQLKYNFRLDLTMQENEDENVAMIPRTGRRKMCVNRADAARYRQIALDVNGDCAIPPRNGLRYEVVQTEDREQLLANNEKVVIIPKRKYGIDHDDSEPIPSDKVRIKASKDGHSVIIKFGFNPAYCSKVFNYVPIRLAVQYHIGQEQVFGFFSPEFKLFGKGTTKVEKYMDIPRSVFDAAFYQYGQQSLYTTHNRDRRADRNVIADDADLDQAGFVNAGNILQGLATSEGTEVQDHVFDALINDFDIMDYDRIDQVVNDFEDTVANYSEEPPVERNSSPHTQADVNHHGNAEHPPIIDDYDVNSWFNQDIDNSDGEQDRVVKKKTKKSAPKLKKDVVPVEEKPKKKKSVAKKNVVADKKSAPKTKSSPAPKKAKKSAPKVKKVDAGIYIDGELIVPKRKSAKKTKDAVTSPKKKTRKSAPKVKKDVKTMKTVKDVKDAVEEKPKKKKSIAKKNASDDKKSVKAKSAHKRKSVLNHYLANL